MSTGTQEFSYPCSSSTSCPTYLGSVPSIQRTYVLGRVAIIGVLPRFRTGRAASTGGNVTHASKKCVHRRNLIVQDMASGLMRGSKTPSRTGAYNCGARRGDISAKCLARKPVNNTKIPSSQVCGSKRKPVGLLGGLHFWGLGLSRSSQGSRWGLRMGAFSLVLLTGAT